MKGGLQWAEGGRYLQLESDTSVAPADIHVAHHQLPLGEKLGADDALRSLALNFRFNVMQYTFCIYMQ